MMYQNMLPKKNQAFALSVRLTVARHLLMRTPNPTGWTVTDEAEKEDRYFLLVCGNGIYRDGQKGWQ